MQAFHEPPSLRPHCSSAQQWVTPKLGPSSTPGQGIQTKAEVTEKIAHTQPSGRKLSQESPMLTAHRPSFPTCLFHPRRVHLLYHLDSPSAASLPYLGLQEQTGPEFSGLQGSYRDSFQEFSSPSAHFLTWRSRSQAHKPHAVQYCAITTFHGKTQTLPLNSAQASRSGNAHGFPQRHGLSQTKHSSRFQR